MRALVLILMFSFPLLCNAGEVYKWRDKDGNIHYSDVEPPKQPTERKVVKAKDGKPLTPEQLAAKDKADKTKIRQAECDKAKANVATISGTGKILMDLNHDGKPQEITPEQRASQTEVMKAAVVINCTQ
ncbi:MAG: DUF4124 domain-containing protein [Arenimonas sp.]